MDQWFLSEELYQHIEDVVMERGLTFNAPAFGRRRDCVHFLARAIRRRRTAEDVVGNQGRPPPWRGLHGSFDISGWLDCSALGGRTTRTRAKIGTRSRFRPTGTRARSSVRRVRPNAAQPHRSNRARTRHTRLSTFRMHRHCTTLSTPEAHGPFRRSVFETVSAARPLKGEGSLSTVALAYWRMHRARPGRQSGAPVRHRRRSIPMGRTCTAIRG